MTQDSPGYHLRRTLSVALASSMVVLLAGTIACAPPREPSPAAESAVDAGTNPTSELADDSAATSRLTESESARAVISYQEGAAVAGAAVVVPLAGLGVNVTELTVGDDSYAVADCYAVAPSADELAAGQDVDRTRVHVVYLAPDGQSAGYLGRYAELVR